MRLKNSLNDNILLFIQSAHDNSQKNSLPAYLKQMRLDRLEARLDNELPSIHHLVYSNQF